MRISPAINYLHSQVKNRAELSSADKAAKPDEHPMKEKPASGEPRDTVTISMDAIRKSANEDPAKAAATSAASASTQSGNSVFDKLAQTFSNVNFVTEKDPFESGDVRNNGRNTVYLDSAALHKLETDPRYAARVFAEIESNMDIVGKGYSYRTGDRTYTLQSSALNLSFYGQGEGSKLVATMFVFDADGKPDTSSPFLSLMKNPGEAIHREIAQTANNSLKKWFELMNVPESDRRYYDGDERWM